jgi:integrase
MAWEIHKAGARAALAPRREPYWGTPLGRGRHVGYRKLSVGGVWIARWSDEQHQRSYKSLGQDTRDFGYDQARVAAETWFKDREAGVTDEVTTVEALCKAYVADMREDGRQAAAYQAEIRFKREVYDTPFGATLIAKLRTAKLKVWRNGVAGGASTQNRSFRGLKAALNFGVTNRYMSAALAIEWKAVKPHVNADGRRLLFLDVAQRRALIEAASGSTRDLLEIAAATGGRPGELIKLLVKDYDPKTKTISFAAKKLRRTVPVTDAAHALLKRLIADKLPLASVIVQADGTPYRHSTVWAEEIRKAAEIAKLPKGVCLYSMRHAWITEALMAGLSTLAVARLTGTSLAMIEEHYGHLVTDSAREQLKSFEMT